MTLAVASATCSGVPFAAAGSITSEEAFGRSSRNREGVRGITLPRLMRCEALVRVRSSLARVIPTFIGPQTWRKLLQRESYSLAQHTRQLMSVLIDLGIEPDGRIGESEYAGLQMPEGVWT